MPITVSVKGYADYRVGKSACGLGAVKQYSTYVEWDCKLAQKIDPGLRSVRYVIGERHTENKLGQPTQEDGPDGKPRMELIQIVQSDQSKDDRYQN